MRARLVVVLATLAVATTGFAAWRADVRFPHEQHARLFATCEGCHAGIVSGDSATMYPNAEACASCHNGTDEKEIAWRGPTRTATNLRFSHVAHAEKAGRTGEAQDCRACHRDEHALRRTFMSVERAEPAKCIGCHAHEAPEHLAATNACATCHVPLADARTLPDSTLAGFPKPPSHASADFLDVHGKSLGAGTAQCATCHTRESCARCHPNADRLQVITALGSDVRVAKLVSAKAPEYPTPASHRAESWGAEHASAAKRDGASCANCHAQTSCRSCHQGTLGAKSIRELPAPSRGNGPGVQLVVERGKLLDAPARATDPAVTIRVSAAGEKGGGKVVQVHPAGFSTNHGADAASGRSTCTGCHEQRTCQSCHEGTSGNRRFHTSGYMGKHAADAYGQEKNCSSCHNTESFCRSCHVQNGMNAKGNGNVAAHTGQPVWLLQHGEAARQGLVGCTTCHQQRDCLRCHSTLSWRVNPHGPNFDARRMADRNAQMCRTCHVGDPLKP
jgi:hypothetical protein